jgi:hypothetical protein
MPTRIEASCACADLSCGARRVEARLRRLQRRRRDEVLRCQADVGGVLALGLDQGRLRRLDQRGTVGGAALHVGEVDHADHLAGLDAVAFGDAEREQRPRRLGAHDRRARRDQRPENSSVSGSRAPTGRATSAATNSSGTGSFLSLSPPRRTFGSTRRRPRRRSLGNSPPIQIRRFALWAGPDVRSKFACRECRTAAPAHPPCDGLRIGGAERHRLRRRGGGENRCRVATCVRPFAAPSSPGT